MVVRLSAVYFGGRSTPQILRIPPDIEWVYVRNRNSLRCSLPHRPLPGGFSNTSATDLGSKVAATALEGIDPSVVDEALMGCVLQAGLGQTLARQIALGAGCPEHVTAMTINKVCGSGLEAAMQADRAIRCQDARVVLCGGAENMTRAPHTGLIRPGAKFGPATFADHIRSRWTDLHAFKGWAMGNAAEWISNEHNSPTRRSRRLRSTILTKKPQQPLQAVLSTPETWVFTGAEVGNRKVRRT